MNFTKKQFVAIITAIKEQLKIDKEKAEALSCILDCEINPHDNSRLTNQLFNLLHTQFPPKNNRCKIQEFCFDYDFGRAIEPKMSIEELWEELCSK